MSDALLERQGTEFPETVTPTPHDAEVARESIKGLAQFRRPKGDCLKVRVQDESLSTEVMIPASAFRLLADILAEMSLGNAVTCIPTHAELTTQQAADMLNVSRPYLVGLLDQGAIKHRMVGTHRRVRFSDLVEYKQRIDDARKQSIIELMREGEDIDMGR